MNKIELQTKANELFAIHKMDTLFMTSDGQGFTEENKHRAEANANTLKDKKVYKFEREEVKQEEPAPVVESSDLDREALAAEYEQLMGKKPAHNMKAETMQSKIDAKKEEIADIPVVPVATEPEEEEEVADNPEPQAEAEKQSAEEAAPDADNPEDTAEEVAE